MLQQLTVSFDDLVMLTANVRIESAYIYIETNVYGSLCSMRIFFIVLCAIR